MSIPSSLEGRLNNKAASWGKTMRAAAQNDSLYKEPTINLGDISKSLKDNKVTLDQSSTQVNKGPKTEGTSHSINMGKR